MENGVIKITSCGSVGKQTTNQRILNMAIKLPPINLWNVN
jgi:hypothetical protein